MDQNIALTLIIIGLTLVAFVREWAAPDVIALTVLCLLAGLGLVPMEKMTDVFRNEAPLTIAALFIIGGALERSGAVDKSGKCSSNASEGERGGRFSPSRAWRPFSARG